MSALNKDINFYVINDLYKTGATYWKDFEQALKSFSLVETSVDKMPVLGIQVGNASLDLIHQLNGENVLVQDYKNSNSLSSDIKSVANEIDAIVKELIDKGLVSYRYCHSILPWSDYSIKVIVPVVSEFVPDSYCNDKILKAGDGIPAISINEMLIDGDGWVNYQDFLRDPSKYVENGVLKVESVNVAYVKSDKLVGVDGQMDLSIDNFEYMANKINKPYYISVYDEQNSRFDRSNFAVMSFDTLPEAVKAWYEVNVKVEFTPGVRDKVVGGCVFNGVDNNLEEITYEKAAELYGFDKIDNVDGLIAKAVKTAEKTVEDVKEKDNIDIEKE